MRDREWQSRSRRTPAEARLEAAQLNRTRALNCTICGEAIDRLNGPCRLEHDLDMTASLGGGLSDGAVTQ